MRRRAARDEVAEAAGWGPEDSFSLGEQKFRAGLDLGIGEELAEPAGAVPVVDDQNLVAPSSVAGAGVDVVTEVAEGPGNGGVRVRDRAGCALD